MIIRKNKILSIDWSNIETVLLDMDGTLLDLHYDDYFWTEYLPQEYARIKHLTLQEAKSQLYPRFKAMEGKLEWYSTDFWSEELQMNIPALKAEVSHLIAIHDGVIEFLHTARKVGKTIKLVTNAHPDVLALKMHHTQLENLFDAIISSHEFKLPKENPEFWHRLVEQHRFDPEHTLFIDDSISVLKSAQNYGIKYLLSIEKPSSQKPARTENEFIMLKSFRELTPHH